MAEKSKKKIASKKLVSELKGFGKKKKQRIWIELAKQVEKPTRQRPTINLWKLGSLAEKNKEKILVVVGKILSHGILDAKVEVSGLSVSSKALQKIEEKSGKFYSLNELMENNVSPSKMVIVK